MFHKNFALMSFAIDVVFGMNLRSLYGIRGFSSTVPMCKNGDKNGLY